MHRRQFRSRTKPKSPLARGAARRLFLVAQRILRDSALAEDALQNALVLAWRRIPHLREPDRFEAWIHRILVHACYDESQRARQWVATVRVLPVDGPSTPDGSKALADRDELERAFRRHAEGLDQSATTPSRFIAIDGKTLRQSFDAFADRKAVQPTGMQGVACFDCHVNGHTNGAIELAPDSRPNWARLRVDTPTMRGNVYEPPPPKRTSP